MESVYRVEDAAGFGPYRDREVVPHADKTWADKPSDDLHPLPWNDGISYPGATTQWRFGFASLAALCRWFSAADRAKIKRLGLWVARYLVPKGDIRHGRRQVIFKANRARRKETLDPTTL